MCYVTIIGPDMWSLMVSRVSAVIHLLLVNYLQMYFLDVGDEGSEDVNCGEEYNEISR